MNIYLIGSLANRKIIELANELREHDFVVFDDWISPGEETDTKWQEYERRRGRTYKEALNGQHARDVFEFDKRHLDAADCAVLVLPAGRSGHLELGYICRDKPGFVLFEEEPDKYDIMYLFAQDIFFNKDDLIQALEKLRDG